MGSVLAVDEAMGWVATILAAAFGARQRFFGPVVFTGGADAEGGTLPLRDHQLEALHRGLRIDPGRSRAE